MSFFKSLFKVAKAVAPIALGFVPGLQPLAAAAIGAGIGAIGGGGIKGALLGGATAGIGSYVNAAGGLGNLAQSAGLGATGAIGPTITGAALPGPSGLAGLLSGAGSAVTKGIGSVLGSGVGGGSSGGILGGNPLLSLANIGGSIYSATAGADAAKTAAAQQSAAANKAIAAQQSALTQIRGDLAPFRDAGANATPVLSSLVNDPQAQMNFIQNNPFYQSLAKDAKDKIFTNAAARGKIGSGGTAEALQNSLLLLGNDLLNQKITQNQNLVATGANAAAQTGTATQNSAQQIGGYYSDQGNSNAAGTIGGYNAKTGAINNALGGLTSLYAIDKGLRV